MPLMETEAAEVSKDSKGGTHFAEAKLCDVSKYCARFVIFLNKKQTLQNAPAYGVF